MSNSYDDTCPACGSAAYIDNMIDNEHDRQEDVVFCTNPACAYFDAESLGPRKLVAFIETAQDVDRLIQQASDKLEVLKKQADEIARMGSVKVETLTKNQEKRQ